MKLNIGKAIAIAEAVASVPAPEMASHPASSPRPPVVQIDDPVAAKFIWFISVRTEGVQKSQRRYKIIATTEEQAIAKLQARIGNKNIIFHRGNTLIAKIKQGKEVAPNEPR